MTTMEIVVFCAAGCFFMVLFVLRVFEDEKYDYERVEKETLCRYKYVTLTAQTAMVSIKSGINFYKDKNGLWFFRNNLNDGLSSEVERVYVKFGFKEKNKFETMYQEYQALKKEETYQQNESENGYQYLLKSVENYRNTNQKKYEESFQSVSDNILKYNQSFGGDNIYAESRI